MARIAPKFEDIGKQPPAFESISRQRPAFEDISKDTSEGIGFIESIKEEFARPAKGAQYVPGLGGIVGAAENLLYLDASHRLQTNYDYSKPIRPAQAMPGAMGHRPARYAHKKRDAKLIEDLILRTQEQQERGYTYGGKVAKGVLNLPTWMAEFAMTGGLATLGSGAAKKAGTKLIGRWAKTKAGKIALRGAGWTGGAITRATLGLGARVTEKALGRQVNVQILGAEEEGWATSFAKAWGDITIEAASETAGAALTKIPGFPVKLLSKTKFGGKFLRALKSGWMKTTGGTAASFAKKIATKGGYSNIIGEYGEERLGTLLRALTAVDDFGVGKDANVIERLMAATKQDLDLTNIAVEFTVLGVIPGGQVALGFAGRLGAKRKSKLMPSDIDSLIHTKTSPVGDAVIKYKDMPGVNIIAEHLVRKYGLKRGSTFYDRKIEKLADGGKKVSDFWNEQANKGWEAPISDVTEAKWKDRSVSKTVNAANSGLTSAGTVLGDTYSIESPHPERVSLANSKADVMYNRLKDENISDDVASKLAQMAGAWTYTTEKIPFDRLLKSDKASILTTLKKNGWKGTQEVTEQIGHNLLEYFGYDYRKSQDIPTAVKAAYDHAMESWLDALVGSIGADGIVSAATHRGERPGKPVLPETEVSPTLALFHGTSDVSATQKEGIVADKMRTGSVSATDDPGFAGKFGANVVKIVIPSNAQGKILDITIDENEKAIIDKGFPWGEFYDPKTANPITRKQQLVGLDALSPEQKKWLTDRGYIGVKFLTTMAGEPSSKVEVRFAENIPPSWVKERVEPIVAPTVEELTGKPLNEIRPQTTDHAKGHPYGLTNRQVDHKLQQMKLKYQDLKRKPTADRTKRDTEEFAFLEKNRTNIKAILERDILSKADRAERNRLKLPPRSIPQPIRTQMSSEKLKKVAREIKNDANLSTKEFNDLADKTVNRRSMAAMNKEQLIKFVEALAESYGTYGELAPDDYDKEVLYGRDEKPMRTVWRDAMASVEELKSKKETDTLFKKPTTWPHARKSLHWLKGFTYSIKNTPIFHLARRLDGGKSGVFSKVLSKAIEHGRRRAAKHKRNVIETVIEKLESRDVTKKDLARMGRSVNPAKWIGEKLGWTKTEVLNVEIEGKLKGKNVKKTHQMTMAELIDVYLISKQTQGKKHLKKGGLIINGTKTGSLSASQIKILQHRAIDDPKAKAVIETILEIGETIWKKDINSVSNKLLGKDLATIDGWWGFEVYLPSKAKSLDAGLVEEKEKAAARLKITDLEVGGIPETNLIRNPGILTARTDSGLPLVVRDAFNRFDNFENTIAEYYGMARPSETARTLINDPQIVEILDQKGYGEVRRNVAEIHRRAETKPESVGGFNAWLTDHLPFLYRAVLVFNPRVILAQATSAFSYGAYVSKKYILTGSKLAAFKGGLNFTEWRETLELSDIAWERFYMGHSSLEMGELAQTDAALRTWTEGKASNINKLGFVIKTADLTALTVGMKIAQAEYQTQRKHGIDTGLSGEWWIDREIDLLPDADIELWRKVKERAKNETPLTKEEDAEKLRAERWQQIVSERAEYLWQRTQPSWDKWNRSLLTSEKGARQLFLLFRSFHEKSLTVFNEAMLDFQHSSKTARDMGNLFARWASVTTGYTINAFFKTLIVTAIPISATLIAGRKWRPPDEKEQHKFFQDLVMSWFAAFPIVGKVVKTFFSRMWDVKAGVKPSYTYEPLDSLPVGVINDLLKSPEDLADGMGHSFAGEHEKAMEAYWRWAKKLITAAGLITGWPAYDIKRIITPQKKEKKKKETWQ